MVRVLRGSKPEFRIVLDQTGARRSDDAAADKDKEKDTPKDPKPDEPKPERDRDR